MQPAVARRWRRRITLLNIAVMGLYDVIAFSQTRTRALERWRYGAVAFAWSNFLTLGPFAGPAIRFWLYRPAVEHSSDLENGVLSITIAFASGLVGWTLATLVVPLHSTMPNAILLTLIAAALVYACVYVGRFVAVRIERFDEIDPSPRAALGPALIGWLDWLLAGVAFLACLHATGAIVADVVSIRKFFLGQAIGLASLVPGGFGSGDVFWMAKLPLSGGVSAAALVAYRLVYYIVPWAAASLVLLSWATRRTSRRVELARRMVAGLVAAGGVLMLLSTATRSLDPRLALLEQVVPLPIVEVSHVAAALTGVMLLILARGLAKGYRAALGATIIVLILAAVSAVLKGLDYEEALILGGLAIAAWSQAPLFDRTAGGEWFTGRDAAVAAVALFLFLGFGAFSFRVTPQRLERAKYFGYRFERARYLRTAGTLAIAVSAGALYLLLRVHVRFTRLGKDEIDRTLELHAAIGHGTSGLMVANGDKAVFRFGERGYCLYRTIGPYLVVFSDPVVATADEREDLLTALFAFADGDRSASALLSDLARVDSAAARSGIRVLQARRGSHRSPRRVTLDGPDGKLYRQILRRGERDRLRMRVLAPFEIAAAAADAARNLRRVARRQGAARAPVLDRILRRGVSPAFPLRRRRERGRADPGVREPAARPAPRRVVGRLDALPHRRRERDGLPVRLALPLREGSGLRAVQPRHGAARERRPLPGRARARAARQHALPARRELVQLSGAAVLQGESSIPDWVPRYMAYQNAWEWPAAITNVSALVAGGWRKVVFPKRNS